MSENIKYFLNTKNGNKYKTGGMYGGQVYWLAPFGWILSTLVEKSDLDNVEFVEFYL